MILAKILLVLSGIIYTKTTIVHMDIHTTGCTDSDGEDMYGLDGEEMAHADFKAQKYLMTLPEFADPFQYAEGTYEMAVANQQICKQNLAVAIQAYKNPPVAEAPPFSSLYPRVEVAEGQENVLICSITGFYPPRLYVTWTRNNKEVTQGVHASQVRMNVNDGTYSQFHILMFSPKKGDIYTCTVEHQALERPLTKVFDVEVPTLYSSILSFGPPAIFCLVGLIVEMLGMATGFFFFIKANKTA